VVRRTGFAEALRQISAWFAKSNGLSKRSVRAWESPERRLKCEKSSPTASVAEVRIHALDCVCISAASCDATSTGA
jgi:hypothetical protein